MSKRCVLAVVAAFICTATSTAAANVVTDWDEIAVKTIQPLGPPSPMFRAMAMMHLAMFNAVNAVEPRYKPYEYPSEAPPETSEEAAAASAAATFWPGSFPTPISARP